MLMSVEIHLYLVKLRRCTFGLEPFAKHRRYAGGVA
jgi:hypothetical protein